MYALTYNRVLINRVRLPILFVVSKQGGGKSPVPVRTLESGLTRRVRPSRLASAYSFSIPRLNLVLTHGIPPNFSSSVYLFIYTAIRHLASPEFIGSRNDVPMAFTAESPPELGL